MEDSRNSLCQLSQEENGSKYRTAFLAFVSNARAITFAMQSEGKCKEGFQEWYESKLTEMKEDDLLRFFHLLRNSDFHEGKNPLSYRTVQSEVNFDEIGEPPEAGAALTTDGDGMFWLVAQGTSREKRIPIEGAETSTSPFIARPPTSHKGRELEANDPTSMCQLVLDYFENLVVEANERFSST